MRKSYNPVTNAKRMVTAGAGTMNKAFGDAKRPAPKPAGNAKVTMASHEAGMAKLKAAEAAGRARQAAARKK